MEKLNIPSNFRSIISDFTKDLSITFSEYSYLWEKWTKPELPESELLELFYFCVKVYPERFFDILYQKDDMFNQEENNIEFLPYVDFKLLFSCQDLSEVTKKTIWKYLQLILFTIVGSIKDKTSFGDTASLFEGIDENELNEKMNETMSGIVDFFKNMENIMDNIGKMNEENEDKKNRNEQDGDGDENDNKKEKMNEEEFKEKFKSLFEETNSESFKKSFPFDMGSMPNIEKIQEHLKTLFEGKIGKLAKEMAEEISGEFSDILGENPEDLKNPQDVIKKIMKDPKKVMNLMKTVGGKLDSKMKSGEISREELMKEASEMLQKMKDMGGTEQFNEMFKNMAKGMGKNMKVDTNALDRMTKSSKIKERMRNNLNQKKMQKLQEQLKLEEEKTKYLLESKDNNSKNLVFKLQGEDSQEKSYIHPDILKEIEQEEQKEQKEKTVTTSSSSKKKKNKNKK